MVELKSSQVARQTLRSKTTALTPEMMKVYRCSVK
jgi:hypothetical protein